MGADSGTVIATMSDLVDSATSNTATISTTYETSVTGGAVDDFADNGFIGGFEPAGTGRFGSSPPRVSD